jgi:hypothetical protein
MQAELGGGERNDLVVGGDTLNNLFVSDGKPTATGTQA